VFAKAKLEGKGSVIQEGVSGVGFVDVLITFSSGLLHVVELKMLKGQQIPGVAQLAAYMAHNGRTEGWLVFFDSRKPNQKTKLPRQFQTPAGVIRVIVIDINPIPPHSLK
jgi:hypothetical protein